MSGHRISIWKCDPVIFFVESWPTHSTWTCSENVLRVIRKVYDWSYSWERGVNRKKIVDKVAIKYEGGRSMPLWVNGEVALQIEVWKTSKIYIFFPILVNSKNTVIMSVKVFEKKSCLETAFLWCYNLSASARILGIYRKPFGFHCIGSRCVISTIYLIYKYLVKIKLILRLPIVQCYLRHLVNEYVCKQTICHRY